MKKAEVRFPDNADLQNDLGYAYRNVGQFEPAFRHYKRALVLDPRHRGAHEYIGEAYLLVDDLPSAERPWRRCGRSACCRASSSTTCRRR